MTEKQPRFSIIIPIYNSRDHIKKCVDSVLGQSYGTDGVEIVLIDDGSDDGSSDICKEYASKYPDVVVYYRQENSGVSAARNKGLDLATGEYIAFIDSDDYVSKAFLERIDEFLQHCPSNVHLITVPVQNFGTRSDFHFAHGKFKGGTRIINLKRPKWDYVCPRVSPAIVPAHIAKAHRFDESITFFEDTKYVTEIVRETMLVGLVSRCRYYYRREAKKSLSGEVTSESGELSLTGGAESKKDFYLGSPKKASLDMLVENLDENGKVPFYFQYLVLCEVRWRILYNVVNEEDVLSPEELEEYRALNDAIFSYLDDEAILGFGICANWQRAYLLSLKHKRNILDEARYDETGALVWNNNVLFYAPSQFKVNLVSYCVIDGVLYLRGMCVGYVNDDVRLYLKCDGEEYDVILEDEEVDVTSFPLRHEEYTYHRKLFLADIELPHKTSFITFHLEIHKRQYRIKRIGISGYESMDRVRPTLKRGGGFIVRRFGNRLSAVEDTTENRLKARLGKAKRTAVSCVKKAKGKARTVVDKPSALAVNGAKKVAAQGASLAKSVLKKN